MQIPKTVPAVRSALAPLLVLAAVTVAYSNHFHNGFHFDDYGRIPENVFVRDLSNIPKFFTDENTSSTLVNTRLWRPVVMTSLAFDYWLGRGYDVFYFQLSTFVWFLGQLLLMYWLYLKVLNRTLPENTRGWLANTWIAWFAVAWYGLHPAIAETVNYINQRADVMSTCALLAALAVYIRYPKWRGRGVYLIPLAIALMSKSAAVVFPGILIAYLYLFEDGAKDGWIKLAMKAVPSLALSLASLWIAWAVAPDAYSGPLPAFAYRITQPYVAFRYFSTFFLPFHLNADTDLQPVTSLFTLEALGGLAFLAALGYLIYAASKQAQTRPIAFGLAWFLLALAPSSGQPLAEVENDHRMFFPFVGLMLAVVWSGAMLVRRQPVRRESRIAVGAGLACLLLVSAGGVWRRNIVWHTDESLWEDVTLKSPNNGRGLMNYGISLMGRGDVKDALVVFDRALIRTPYYPTLEINLGVANAALGRDSEAEQHYQRAIQLDPRSADPYFYYAQWLSNKSRYQEAANLLKQAIANNSNYLGPRLLMMYVDASLGQGEQAIAMAKDTLKIAPGDPTAQQYAKGIFNVRTAAPADAAVAPGQATAESLLDDSLHDYQAGNYPACITAAQAALKLRPGYAEAYNNIAAAYQSMGQWDQAIQAAQEAIRLKPDFPLARNNLAYAESQKKLHAGGK